MFKIFQNDNNYISATTWDPICGPLWERGPNSELCYQFNNQLVSWQEARAQCQTAGGDLLSIVNIREQFYIAGIIYM